MTRPNERGERDYLELRNGIWHIRFQYPPAVQASACELYGWAEWQADWKKSLGTRDRREADVLAQPYVANHKELMLYHAARTDRSKKWGDVILVWTMEPSDKAIQNPDGSTTMADEHFITHIDKDGNVRRQPNKRRLAAKLDLAAVGSEPEYLAHAAERRKQRALTEPDVDLEAIDHYIKKLSLRKDDADGTRRTLADFKAVTGGRAIARSSEEDVENLIEWLAEERDLTGSRIKKLVSFLRAAVNYGIKKHPRRPLYQRNIFTDFSVPDTDEEGENRRPPYTETDVASIKANLGRFDDEQTLMLVYHVSSSIRPGGIYSITSDEWEDGEDPDTGQSHRTRHARIRRDKGVFGRRNLPIPQAVLDLKKADGSSLLPAKIDGSMFTTPLPQLLAEINRVLDAIGLARDATGKRVKTLYCGRHRGKDRLMSRGCVEDMRKAIMGHARKIEAHDLYGTGFPMWQIKPWIDKIGF